VRPDTKSSASQKEAAVVSFRALLTELFDCGSLLDHGCRLSTANLCLIVPNRVPGLYNECVSGEWLVGLVEGESETAGSGSSRENGGELDDWMCMR
jgi:hypothetical protein